MDELAPAGPVYQAGTLSGNPLATAAALVVLRRLRDPGVYARLEEAGARLEAGLRDAAAGAPVCVQRVGAMATLFFREGPVRSFEDAAASDTERYGAWFRHLLARGIYVAPSQFEALFVSTAHGEAEIDATVEAARELFARLISASGRRSPTRPAARARSGRPRCGPRRERDDTPVFSRARPTTATRSGSSRSTRATSSTTAGRASSPRPTPTPRSCSATTSTRTGSCASPRTARWPSSRDLAELISLCAQLRAEERDGRRRRLGRHGRPARRPGRAPRERARRASPGRRPRAAPGRWRSSRPARSAVERALALHAARVD